MSRLNRRTFLAWAAATAGTAAMPRGLSAASPDGAAGDRKPSGGRKPNVLFIAVDDLRPELGYLGGRSSFIRGHLDAARDGEACGCGPGVVVCAAVRQRFARSASVKSNGLHTSKDQERTNHEAPLFYYYRSARCFLLAMPRRVEAGRR
jgi:hypothetical protein